MISLLRKIRQKLLQQNKVTQYLIYAIGEIALVMIGILLALQVNSWNETRKENLEEIQILKSLKEDFLQSKVNVDSTIKNQLLVMKYLTALNRILIEGDRTASPDSLALYLYQGAASYWKTEPTNGTYEAMIGAGKTGLLKNNELNRLLAAYSAEIKYGFEDETFSMDLTTLVVEKSAGYVPVFANKLYQDFGYLRNKKIYTEQEINKAVNQLIDDRSLAGVLVNKSAQENNRLNYHISISKKLNKILILIEQELELKDDQ